jgi:hypothetical protein
MTGRHSISRRLLLHAAGATVAFCATPSWAQRSAHITISIPPGMREAKRGRIGRAYRSTPSRRFPGSFGEESKMPPLNDDTRRPDCMAGVRRLELRNPRESYVFEMS